MLNAQRIFHDHAADYNAARRRLVPPFDSFYATAVNAVNLCGQPASILDLGAGTGLLSSYLRAAFPDAHLSLVDGAGAMLDQARALLGPEDTSYHEADLRDPLPEGPFDAVVSALAIHHLGDDDKRALMVRITKVLRTGGVFVNAEQVAGSSPSFSHLYAEWHKANARTAGSDDAEWSAAVDRMSHDQCVSVETQIAWLTEAGFAEVDCLFKDHRFAVITAVR